LRAARKSLPTWFEDAKLGIFVHWTLASVPAWAPDQGTLPELLQARFDEAMLLSPYAEWYWNALRVHGSPTARHHAKRYGDAPFEAFRAAFEAGLARFDPDAFARLFEQAGARYVVLVTKHHDGYCLWPTRHPNPRKPGWHSARDVVGELAAAVRARGMRFGVYYSGGLDWTFEPRPILSLADVPAALPCAPDYAAYADAQVRELVELHAPSVLWNDIAWPRARAPWRLFDAYYGAVPDGVVNDRFLPMPAALARALRTRPGRALLGALLRRAIRRPKHVFAPPRPPHCDFRTPEYASFPEVRHEKWEATRGIGHSFGYNRNEPEQNFVAPDELVRSFVDVVAKNGNLLLNVGPTSEGEIPEIQASRLRALGGFLREAGEAIYATRPWHTAEARSREGVPLRFTTRDDVLYAIALAPPPGDALTLREVGPRRAELLGHGPLDAQRDGNDLRIRWPAGLAGRPAHALRLRPA
jgi:alpha-L-fucosidase